jgi:rhamnose transport system permease protein
LAKLGLPMWAVVPLILLAGATLGAINGELVAGLRLPSIVVTLGTMAIFRESLRWITQGQFINNLPTGFQWFGLPQHDGEWLLIACGLIVFGVFAWAMRWLAAGRAVYAVGSDEEAARLAGIRPARVVFCTFVLMGMLTALAAMLQAVRSPDVDPNQALGWELSVIAAVVVGGTAITGGRGTLPGTLVGVLLLSTLDPSLPFLNVGAEWDKAVRGTIILLAVASDGVFRRRN